MSVFGAGKLFFAAPFRESSVEVMSAKFALTTPLRSESILDAERGIVINGLRRLARRSLRTTGAIVDRTASEVPHPLTASRRRESV